MNNRERFEEIKYEMQDLLEEALELIPETEEDAVASYWYSQILTAIDNNHDYLGGCSYSMQDTLDGWQDES